MVVSKGGVTWASMNRCLGSFRPNRCRVHRVSFDQIERVLGFKLPKSAYEHEAWWSNNATGHSHCSLHGSRRVGVRKRSILRARKVTFQRAASSSQGKPRKRDPWGCMAGTVTIMPGRRSDRTERAKGWNAEEGRFSMNDLLLDTCAVLWLAQGAKISAEARRADRRARCARVSYQRLGDCQSRARRTASRSRIAW